MKIAIDKIRVATRIRKEISNVAELAANIRDHGLITPIAVMPLNGEEYQLLAGLRRLRAVELNGESEIDVKVIPPINAEEALWVESSENLQREPFTFSELMDFARLIEEIEREKAKERMSKDGRGGITDAAQGTDPGPDLSSGERRDIVGSKIGSCGQGKNFICSNLPKRKHAKFWTPIVIKLNNIDTRCLFRD